MTTTKRRIGAKKRRIGAKMVAAQDYVILHQGCSKLAVAKAVGPHGSSMYGYAIVNRAIAAGMITAHFDGNRYHLTVGKGWHDFGDCTCGTSVYRAMNGLWYHSDAKPTGTMTRACTQKPANQR